MFQFSFLKKIFLMTFEAYKLVPILKSYELIREQKRNTSVYQKDKNDIVDIYKILEKQIQFRISENYVIGCKKDSGLSSDISPQARKVALLCANKFYK